MPVVITEGLGQIDEAAQFYIVNTKAKKMDVALTRRLLIERGAVRDIADNKPWEIKAVQTTIILNKNLRDNPWYEAIRQPNEDKLTSHIATEKSFVPSLRAIFLSKKTARPKAVAKSLAAMWRAIEAATPEAFEEPKRYLIQKTPGIFAFNYFLAPRLLAKRSGSLSSRLDGLRALGATFWRKANRKGASRFGTGMGGYANLALHLQRYLKF